MKNKAVINKIIPFSNVDGPGNRYTIFFQECNLNCIYCHNPETINKCINCMKCIDYCKTNAIKNIDGQVVYDEKLCTQCDECIRVCNYNSSPKTKVYTVSELVDDIKQYKNFIRGITVSGGESTLQQEFIIELFKEVKKLDLTCFVDSNGFFDVFESIELVNITDKFLFDVKTFANFNLICSKSDYNIKDNLIYLLKENKIYEVRTVVLEYNGDATNTVSVVSDILGDYPDVTYKLIKVHNKGLKKVQKDFIDDKIPTDKYLKQLVSIAKSKGVQNIEII